MRALIDTDGQEFPAKIARRIYGRDFLQAIGRQFHFNPDDSGIVARIFHMGASYIRLRRMEDRDDFRQLRAQYLGLSRKIDLFRQLLDKNKDLEFPDLMYLSALQLGEPPPKGHFPGLNAHELKQSGEPYFLEFLRLLDILSNGIKSDLARSAPKPGPKVNSGLEVIAIQASQFFAVELKKRPFTIDPHKPFKPTEAFDFVKSLVEPLDSVTDDQIVTAIRSAKSKLAKSKLAKSKLAKS
jgi:hypothetical protein